MFLAASCVSFCPKTKRAAGNHTCQPTVRRIATIGCTTLDNACSRKRRLAIMDLALCGIEDDFGPELAHRFIAGIVVRDVYSVTENYSPVPCNSLRHSGQSSILCRFSVRFFANTEE